VNARSDAPADSISAALADAVDETATLKLKAAYDAGDDETLVVMCSDLIHGTGLWGLRSDAIGPAVWKPAMARYQKTMGRHVPRLVAKSAAQELGALVRERQAAAWPDPIDFAELAERDPEPPAFIIDDWLPIGHATLIAGHGGVGKSGIALYLAVCIALGLPFFGLTVTRRRTMYLSCEDREGVLHWRLSRICAHLGVNIIDLKGWLDVIDLVGHDCVLWERAPRTGNALTPAYGQVQARIEEY
jgi:hypothetical protein